LALLIADLGLKSSSQKPDRAAMDKVRVHCYGCPAVVAVASRSPEEGLILAETLRHCSWALQHKRQCVMPEPI
jgi:hypothetical protein